jgi:surface polysaccharide O-acyltransferase-like enzyme
MSTYVSPSSTVVTVSVIVVVETALFNKLQFKEKVFYISLTLICIYLKESNILHMSSRGCCDGGSHGGNSS